MDALDLNEPSRPPRPASDPDPGVPEPSELAERRGVIEFASFRRMAEFGSPKY